MSKKNIEFYSLDNDKTEFLFESDAEKAVLNEAAKPKRPKVYKRIIVNSLIICFIITMGFYGVSSYTNQKIVKLKASAMNKTINKEPEEKMNSSSDDLKLIKSNNSKYELVINKANPINEVILNEYKIVNVEDNIIPNIKLEEQTYKSYLNLKTNLLERGYYINIRSGYRTFNESQKIYNSYAKNMGQSYAEKYVAKPGTSEHNAGIAFDFIISSNKNSLKTNYDSDEYFYLENIAYLYGFIIRYPKDKEQITGYSYEPWHLRYVGEDLAKYLKKNNLTLEEYYETRE